MKAEKRDFFLKKPNITGIILLAGLAAYSILMFRMFDLQTQHAWAHDIYDSDMEAYLLTMMGQDSGFDFPYPIFFMLGRFFMLFTGVETAGALAATVLNSLSIPILYYFMREQVFGGLPGTEKTNGENVRRAGTSGICRELLLMACVFAVFFVSMLFSPKGIYLPGMTHKYLGVFSPNPYHNATYMATRPFAIGAFFLFARILGYYEREVRIRDYIWFGVFLFLTTMTKPSFTLALVSTAGLIMALRLIRAEFLAFRGGAPEKANASEKTDAPEKANALQKANAPEKADAGESALNKMWKAALPSLKLTLAFLPTFLVLLYQFGGVFGKTSKAGEDGGIGFGLALAWKVHMENIPFAIVLGLAFPGLVVLLNLNKLKENRLYLFSWELLVVSLAEVLLLYEKGDRFVHMNFSWGYMHGMFFVFVSSIIILLKNTFEAGRLSWPSGKLSEREADIPAEPDDTKGKVPKRHVSRMVGGLLLAAQWAALLWHLGCGIVYFLYIMSGQFYYCF